MKKPWYETNCLHIDGTVRTFVSREKSADRALEMGRLECPKAIRVTVGIEGSAAVLREWRAA